MADQETPIPHQNVHPVNIQQEMKDCYLDYAMSVIIGRALPDVRDGMKPVHRRVLYAMNEMSNFHNRPYLKSARVVGDVLGKYHPHGDSSVYGTVVRLAQDFSLRYPLVDGQGNFGSIDGDNAAAMRYTEIRMMKIAEDILQDLDKETVEWQPNYDGSLQEPRVLPTKIPNLLINGSSGIAVGMATNIPPHNLNEITNGLIALLDNRNMSIDELIRIIPGPDFPTAGAIHGVEGIKSAYHTGKGVIQLRAKAEIEPMSKDRERIVVTEIPYMVNKAKLIERIAELVNDKELTGISDIRDESSREGIRIAIDLKKGEMGQVVLNRLYKTTQLQSSFGIIFLAISNGGPKVMNLKDMLLAFLDHRREIIIRRTIYDLKKTRARAHVLEGLKSAVENIDAMVDLIKKAEGPNQARAQMMERFSLSDIQATAILEMRLQRLTGLERDKIVNEYEEAMKEIARLEGILADEGQISQIIRAEFLEIIENYGDKRRTEIVGRADEIMIGDLITREEQILTITHKGYIKRMPMDTFVTQKRGGKGLSGGDTVDEDFYNEILTANTHSTILFFTSKGTVFAQKVYNIPEGSRTSKGRNIANIIQIPPGEKIKAIKVIEEDQVDGKFLLFATEQGVIKKSPLDEYRHIKAAGIRAINIQDGDNLMAVRLTDGTKDVFMCSSSGKVIRFPEEDVRTVGRVSMGVKGLTLEEGDKVVSMEVVDDTVEVMSVTENGYGKRSSISEYRKQGRGGKGILAMRLNDKTGGIVGIRPVTDKDDLMIITDGGLVIRFKLAQVSLLGRVSQGVRLIKVKEGEKVVAVEKIAETDEANNDETPVAEVIPEGQIAFRALVLFSLALFASCDFTPTLHKTILEAQSKISQQKYDEAAALYESIVQGYLPKDIRVKIYYQLGELYSIHLGKNALAVSYYKRIGEVTEDPLWLVKVEEKIAEINFGFLKDYKASIVNYGKLTQFRPKLNKLDFYELQLGLSYMYDGQLDRALTVFGGLEANQNHEYFIKSFYYLGLIHFQKKEWPKAIAYWKEYIKLEKRKDSVVQTKFLMANAYETMENLKNAYNLYYSLLGEYPNTQVLQNRLNSIYERQVARKR